MMATTKAQVGLKQKIGEEMKQFGIIFLYLCLLIGSFNIYRWLLMAEYHVGYFVYGYTLIESLVLAKIILIGNKLGMGKRFDDRPLIYPTLYKTMLFALCTLAFSVLEHLCTGFMHGLKLSEILPTVMKARYELLSRILIMFVAFIPFFAFQELQRTLGEVRLYDMFFRSRVMEPPQGH